MNSYYGDSTACSVNTDGSSLYLTIDNNVQSNSCGRSPSLIEMGGLDEISAYVIMPEGLMAPQPIHGISGVAELSYGKLSGYNWSRY